MKKSPLLIGSLIPAALSLSASAQFSVQYLNNFGPAVCFRMNDSGQIAGDKQINALTTAIRYTPGAEGVVARSIPAGSGLSYALGINNAGACIGQIDGPGSEPSYAALWSASNVLTPLPTPAGAWTYNTGTDINDANVACGYVTQAVVGADPQAGWRWTSRGGLVMLPQLNGGNYSFARDINASGMICGYAGANEDSPMHAVVWDAGNQIIDLGFPTGATNSFAQAINNAGVVVGSTSNGIAWKYTPGTGMAILPKFAGSAASTRTYAMGVNNSGWVVGVAWQSGEPHTAVWSPDNVLYKISAYVSGADFYFPSDESVPLAINDNNELVVRAYDFVHAGGNPVAVRFQFGFPVECPADINGDTQVNVTDLLAVISAWGTCTGCDEDTNDDGGVNVTDLLAVISNWGACD